MPLYRDQSQAVLPAFIPVKAMPKPQAETSAVIELSFGEQSITV